MPATYQCHTCKSQTTRHADWPVDVCPKCVNCDADMVIVGATKDDDATSLEVPAVAAVNIGAYQDGLAEIEEAKTDADANEREYLRAKDYAAKAKKRLETAEVKLRDVVQRVADRLRPRPLFESAAADHHTDEELVALLAAEQVIVTTEKIREWTDAERADARAWALAAHSEQPRLMPPFLWAPEAAEPVGPPVDAPRDAGEAQTTDQAPAVDAGPAPPAPEPEATAGHRYPVRKKRKPSRRLALVEDPEEPAEATA